MAKELGVDSKDIVAKCQAEDIPDIINHMSVVSAGLAATIREWFSEEHLAGSGSATAVETAAVVDVAKARAKARKRPGKAKHADDDTSAPDDGAASAIVAEPPARKRDHAEAEATAAPVEKKPVRGAKAAKPRAAADEPTALIDQAAPIIADRPDIQAPEETAKAPAAGKARRTPPTAPAAPPAPAPVMNVPARPDVVAPVGPMLDKPQKSELKGPRLIRIEKADVVSAPKPRGPAGPMAPRGGPRAGRGVGAMPPDLSDFPAARGAPGGPGGPRRNKRRSASAADDAGRTARSAHFASSDDERPFNWRQQDLLERENRLNRAGGFFKAARRDNLKRQTGGGHRAVMPAESGGKVRIVAPISIKDLSAATGIKATELIKRLVLGGTMVTVNSVLGAEAAVEAVLDYNIELEIDEQRSAEQKITDQFKTRTASDERRRSPVVTILGHVDHGKTSLLDKIRNTNVAAGEAGGITQATSAFQVPVRVGEKAADDGEQTEHLITFIDTPGHEAFTEMRARGAKVTDVVVLVVAADDGVMPQTVESINHAKAASVPIVVALNKIDKPEATDKNIQRILGQLAEHELNPVEWGGATEVVRTSATKGTGITDLLEILDYQAQLLDLKADYGGDAEGTVLEAALAEGRGPIANILVQQGTLKKGDFIVVGRAFGRVRDIVNDRGQRIDLAEPSTPVAISGINGVPDAGDKFYVVKTLKGAEAASAERQAHERGRDLAKEKITLDNVFKHLEATGKKELPLIVKADVNGSLETLRTVLNRISTDEIAVSIKHSSVGGVNESDIALAEATAAIIVGFNVTSSAAARKAAETRGVDIRFYDVIYDLTDDVKKAAEGLLAPELKLEVLGHAEVRAVFKISKVGQIAGCYVTDGVIERNSQIRVTRQGIVIEKDRRLQQLKRFKDDVKEVRAGQECGMKIDGYDDIREGDVLECYKTREVKRTL
ncbi:MAG: translation initiation factor IF-2 [Phycisphaerales bacterium]|nr:translation initiation factor IF-2 [Phycisphaerales bacterium]MCI0676882.1 translation initiation factor IF-2 [Phycisphaerales bacterium]